MGRVLYGVHGTGHGHAMRGLTIARKLRQHEFLFIANDDAPGVLEPEFAVHRIPNFGTVFKNYKVDLLQTIAKSVPIFLWRKKYIQEVENVIRSFQPDVCMTDLEYFVPRAAKKRHLPCLTLDHQHVITCCSHSLPANMLWDTWLQGLTPKYLFRPTEANLLISFYSPKVLPGYRAMIAPPILRDAVLEAEARDDGHVVVYQSNSTDQNLIAFLQQATKKTCYVFGYTQTYGQMGNVIFRPKSEEGFLNLLAGCSYVIQGGSHTLMSEALYLGKPIFSLPLSAMVEQRFNALYLERLGFGVQADMKNLSVAQLQNFETHLELYKKRIAGHTFCGNDLVFDLIDQFILTGRLDI